VKACAECSWASWTRVVVAHIRASVVAVSGAAVIARADVVAFIIIVVVAACGMLLFWFCCWGCTAYWCCDGCVFGVWGVVVVVN